MALKERMNHRFFAHITNGTPFIWSDMSKAQPFFNHCNTIHSPSDKVFHFWWAIWIPNSIPEFLSHMAKIFFPICCVLEHVKPICSLDTKSPMFLGLPIKSISWNSNAHKEFITRITSSRHNVSKIFFILPRTC